MSSFHAETYQNEYVPVGATEMHAVVSISARTEDGAVSTETGPSEHGDNPAAEVVLIIDASGSMNYPRAKIHAAREATMAAIDGIRDGVSFAVIAGYEQAEIVYPPAPERPALVEASAASRKAAKRVVGRLDADGGTAMGVWLRRALSLFSREPGVIRRAILLTDGRNESEAPEALDDALAECAGRFECDCRGVGADWEVAELRRIGSALLGSVDIIPDPGSMRVEFESMMQRAMAKQTADVRLRLWTPQGARVSFVKQVSPDVDDLTAARVDVDERTGDYPTGSWGDETRDYHVCIAVPSGEVGDEMMAGRVSLVVDGVADAAAPVRVVWTDDAALSTRISREVAHYTGQVELADAVQEGVRARQAGDTETATRRLGRAVQLAAASGDQERLRELERIVDIDDATTGTVRLKREVDRLDEMVLETRSVKTMRIAREAAP